MFQRSRYSLIVAATLFITILPCASADVFSLDYSGAQTSASVESDILATHVFVVRGVPLRVRTEWRVNGSPKQTDWSGLLGIDPRFTWICPSGGRPDHTIQAWIYDANDSLLKYFTWRVDVLRPDLTVSRLRASSYDVVPGENIRVDAWIKNLGAGSAPQSTVSFEWDNGYLVATGLIPNIGFLSPGQEVQETVYAFTIPASSGPGYHRIHVVADSNHVTHDSNYFNNFRYSNLLVIPGNVTVPDFSGIEISVLGSDITLKLTYGLSLGSVSYETSDTIPAGEVISQSLAVGASVPVGTSIDFVVSLGTAPSIRVRTPKSGEMLVLGGKRRIRWRSSAGLGGDVRIELWQNGSKVRNIRKATPNDRRFKWRIRSDRYVAGANYRVRVISLVDNTIQDFSKGTFSIVSN